MISKTAVPKMAQAKANIWPWLEPFSGRKSFKPFELFTPRSAADSHRERSERMKPYTLQPPLYKLSPTPYTLHP